MPTDRALVSLLRSLQVHTDQQSALRHLSSTTYLLARLGNPLNLSLLTSNVLRSPAIWTQVDGLRTCLHVMNVFQSAAFTVLRAEDERASSRHDGGNFELLSPESMSRGDDLSRLDWVKAVVNGADSQSPTWKHLLVLSGLLIGFEGQGRKGLSRSLRTSLEKSFVEATNRAAEEARHDEDLSRHCITLALNYLFELLSDLERARLDYDTLLPVLIETAFFSEEGYHSGLYLLKVDADMIQNEGSKTCWPVASPSYQRLSKMSGKPLVSSMGPLSRLIAHAVEHIHGSWLLPTMIDDLREFSTAIASHWCRTKFSEVDAPEEATRYDTTTLETTLPALWSVLRSGLFATVLILRSVMARAIGDAKLATDQVAPQLATQSLHILRNLSFVSLRFGASSFSQYTFAYLTAIDVISSYPARATSLMQEIAPSSLGQASFNPVDRSLDLFFLNTAEHFVLVLPAQVNETLLVSAAAPYLGVDGHNHFVEVFESAHSVMLAVLSAPQNVDLAAIHLPFYVDALFKVFPTNLSPRQFRFAFKTLLNISTAPSPLAAKHPHLPETLLELLHNLAMNAPFPSDAAPSLTTSATPPVLQTNELDADLDQQAILTLTLIDSLPFLPAPILGPWLTTTANLISRLESEPTSRKCKERFWEVITSGGMDIERGQICVAWWSTRGGKELVLRGGNTKRQTSGAPDSAPSKL